MTSNHRKIKAKECDYENDKGALLALIIIAILSGSVYVDGNGCDSCRFLQRIPVVGEQLQPGSKRALTPEERLQEKVFGTGKGTGNKRPAD